jgi:methylated-DNA-[protein]-cysteine S-methyltransferase
VASDVGISRVILPHADAIGYSGLKIIVPSELTERVAHMLKQYFKGIMQPFENIPLDIIVSGSFRRHVLEIARTIPFGEIRSYAQVACLACSPNAARAVGGAMAANPVPIIIPCHRVVAADGRLTGFSAPGGLEMKKNLLKMEGVEFKGERTIQKINVINR